MEAVNEKLSIKNLLFCKAMPNYVIPIPTGGHSVFGCIDCGDKFLLESSYEYHVNRKSIMISYGCRYCSQMKIFYNRCNLLAHIRSHAYKTATINVTDLKIEPLPLTCFNDKVPSMSDSSQSQQSSVSECNKTRQYKDKKILCLECKTNISDSGPFYKDRAKHYMQFTNEIHSCPVCMFALPTVCGLKAHLRIHLKIPPYYCPECGIYLHNKSVFYPYNHDCDGFKMMRATARVKCPGPECHLIHPNEFKDHLVNNHLKKVYKCPYCFVACLNESMMTKHLEGHKSDAKASLFYQCEMCPGRLVLNSQIDNHLNSHINNNMYPCWTCGVVFQNVVSLIQHHIDNHDQNADVVSHLINLVQNDTNNFKPKKVYRVVKRCDQCLRSFTYKCEFDQIKLLPNECPYKCTKNSKVRRPSVDGDSQIICHICRQKVSIRWENVKMHYMKYHKEYRCLDINVNLTRLDISPHIKKKKRASFKKPKKIHRRYRNEYFKKLLVSIDSGSMNKSTVGTSEFKCGKCEDVSETKELFEEHLITHRDPFMAYQCMACGESFVVKPSFSTHLLVEHAIDDVEEYIAKNKQCYNKNALSKYVNDAVSDVPLSENQCTICREQFDNPDDLQKHFRVHGMAFLLKNNSGKSNNNAI